MVARMTGASLGFLAFTVAIVAGMAVGNPVNVTLSRSIYALLIFTVLGMLLGGAAQLVIQEHGRQRDQEMSEDRVQEELVSPEGAVVADETTKSQEPTAAA